MPNWSRSKTPTPKPLGRRNPLHQGKREAEEEEVEIEDEGMDDAAFIEEQEEEDADVTDIIGGDIETEEES